MTLSPSRELGTRFSIVNGEWVEYELANVCAVPGCYMRPEPGSHHICRRSDTAGPKDWVGIDGLVVPNRCRLCPGHHRAVTGEWGGHRARIVWADRPQGHWRWQIPSGLSASKYVDTEWVDVGPLKGIEGMYTEEEHCFG